MYFLNSSFQFMRTRIPRTRTVAGRHAKSFAGLSDDDEETPEEDEDNDFSMVNAVVCQTKTSSPTVKVTVKMFLNFFRKKKKFFQKFFFPRKISKKMAHSRNRGVPYFSYSDSSLK
jgi:hypothetical protein